MKEYICNIITNRRIGVDKLIRKSCSMDNVDMSLPTLLVGWRNVKRIYPSQPILEKKISDRLYWTFDKDERRNEFDRDLRKFVSGVISEIAFSVKYRFINILTCGMPMYRRILSFINSPVRKTIWIDNGSFMYIYYSKTTVGISLDDMDYANVNVNKVINKVKDNPDNHVFLDLSKLSYGIIKMVGDNKYIIPYLLEKQEYL